MTNRVGLRCNKRLGKALSYPCADCFKEGEGGTLQCGACKLWCHRSCEKLTVAEMETLNSYKGEYICRRCCINDNGEFDFEESLQRLIKVCLHNFDTFYSLQIGTNKYNYI